MDTNKIDIKKIIQEQYKKCVTDPIYFIRNFCQIQHPTKGRMLFDLYPYQERCIHDFEQHQVNIVLKGRQIGLSTAVSNYALWLMLFHRDKNILVIAIEEKTAKNLITKVKFAYDNLPSWLKIPIVDDNKLSFSLTNGSKIRASTSSPNAGRSEGLSLLILDEAAFIKNAQEIWASAFPTLSTGGKAVIISTPNGLGNFFHQKWVQATDQDSEISISEELDDEYSLKMNPILLDWSVHPERDLAWRKRMGKIQGEQKARQEFDAEFIGSGHTVFDADLIEQYAKQVSDPAFKMGFDGNLWVWKQPMDGHSYILCADVARGDGRDKSGFHVIDVDSNEQVAEYRGMIPTKEYGHLIMQVATMYFDALVVVENNSVGLNTIQVLLDRNYKNLFHMTKDIRYVDENQFNNKINAEERKAVPGFTTSHRTRPLMIAKLDEYLRDWEDKEEKNTSALKLNSVRLINELRVFIWKTGLVMSKAEAMEGYNDDLIMALAMGLWVRDTALKLKTNNMELTRESLNRFTKNSAEVAQPVIYMQGMNRPDPYKLAIRGTNQYSDKGHEDLRWLLG